jgi:hypothetical protein
MDGGNLADRLRTGLLNSKSPLYYVELSGLLDTTAPIA